MSDPVIRLIQETQEQVAASIRMADAVRKLRAALQAVIDTPYHPMRKKCKEIAAAALEETKEYDG